MLIRLGLVVVSVAFALGIFEVGLRAVGYQAIFEVYSKPSIFWIYDELLGWRHEPNVSGTYVGPRPWPVEFRTPIRINSLGLRGPELPALPPGGIRVLVLGDSLVAGFEVEWEEHFLVRIERALARRLDFPVQIVNAGVRGYGTDQYLLYYRERGRSLEPDLVVAVHSTNDLEDNVTLHRMRRPFGKAAFAPRPDALELVGHPVPHYPLCSAWILDETFTPARIDGPGTRLACWLQTGLADRSALFTFLSQRIRRSPGLLKRLYDLGRPPRTAALLPALASARAATPPSSEARYALTTRLYVELAEAARRNGAEFLAIIGYRGLDKLDRRALQRAGVAVHRLRIESLVLTERDIRFHNDAHFNARGHELLAYHLEPVFEERIRAARRR